MTRCDINRTEVWKNGMNTELKRTRLRPPIIIRLSEQMKVPAERKLPFHKVTINAQDQLPIVKLPTIL